MSFTQSQFEFLNEKNINDVLQNGNAITGPLLFADGSSATPSIAFSGDTNTGIYRQGNDVLGIITAGSVRFLIGTQTIQSTLRHRFTSGTAVLPSITFTDDTDTGFFSSGAGQIGITTDGVESVKVTRTSLSLNADGASINLKSPNGTMFSVSVNNAGQLVVSVVG